MFDIYEKDNYDEDFYSSRWRPIEDAREAAQLRVEACDDFTQRLALVGFAMTAETRHRWYGGKSEETSE